MEWGWVQGRGWHYNKGLGVGCRSESCAQGHLRALPGRLWTAVKAPACLETPPGVAMLMMILKIKSLKQQVDFMTSTQQETPCSVRSLPCSLNVWEPANTPGARELVGSLLCVPIKFEPEGNLRRLSLRLTTSWDPET